MTDPTKGVKMTNVTIKVYTKEVYGKMLIYMVDTKESQAVQRLTGNKTISQGEISMLKTLGVNFEQVLPNSVV